MGIKGKKSSKNPPILSHEFIIQNHADIVACFAMIFIVGLMFQATSSLASRFVTIQHNVTSNDSSGVPITSYTTGPRDALTVFFYLLIVIIGHAVIQEFILDKLNRKLHLSKVKNSKFNESGQLVIFYAFSFAWATHIAWEEKYLINISMLWNAYPHVTISFLTKFFFLVQFAYWVHIFPELYLQKVKKDEMPARIQYTLLYLLFIGSAYVFNFTPVAIILLALHFLVETVFHLSKLLYFFDKKDAANSGFMVWNALFVPARLATICVSVITFWFGLGRQKSAASAGFASGDFNAPAIRIVCLIAICFVQSWMVWNYALFQLRRKKLKDEELASVKRSTQTKKAPKKSKGSDGESVQVNGDAKKKN